MSVDHIGGGEVVKTSLPPGYVVGYEDGRRHEHYVQRLVRIVIFGTGALLGAGAVVAYVLLGGSILA